MNQWIGIWGAALLTCAVSLEARAACERDSDCKRGRVCSSGKCVAARACTKDADCPGESVCEANACVAPEAAPLPPVPKSSSPRSSKSSPGTLPPLETAPREPPPALPPPAFGSAPSTRSPALAEGDAGYRPVYDVHTWPQSTVERPLVIAKGMTEVTGILDKDLSADFGSGSHPLGLGAYAYYGAADRLAVGIGNVSFCLVDCGGGNFFQAISLDAHYGLIMDTDLNVVPEVSLFANSVSPFDLTFSPGVELAWRLAQRFQLWVNPRFTLGLVGRSDSSSPDLFTVTVQPRYELLPKLTLVPTVALNIPLEDAGHTMMPVGIGLHYVIARPVDIGGDFTFGSIIPQSFGPVSTGPFDFRSLRIYGTFRI